MSSMLSTPFDLEKLFIEKIETDYYVIIDHDMSKGHYALFVACVYYNRVLLVKPYPEEAAEYRFPKKCGSRGNIVYAYCSEHGLRAQDVRTP